jgi:hypothetical protein
MVSAFFFCIGHPVLYSLPNIVWVIKSRRMRWAGNVAHMEEECTGCWWRNLRERDHWGDPDVDGRIILTQRGLWGLNGVGSG